MAGVPAGRLSIEIVAEIARLSKDLESAKRQVAAASRDIGQSAQSANDNIAGMGTAMGGVNRMSRSMSANFLNLSRQGQDVATMFAMGANPMQIFTSQAAQIVDVLGQIKREANETGTSLTAMTMGGLRKLGPYALIAAAAVGSASIALSGFTDRINENSDVTVTWQDTALGAFDMVANYLNTTVVEAFKALGIDVAGVWDAIVSGVFAVGNAIMGTFVGSYRAVIAAWQTFPGAFADLIISGVNAAIAGMESFVNASIALANSFTAQVGIDGIEGVSFGRISNQWAGQARAAGGNVAGAFVSGYQDFYGKLADLVSPFAQDRARERMNADAASAGGAAGQRAGAAAAAALAAEVQEALDKLKQDARDAADIEDAAAAQDAIIRNKNKTAADNLRRKTDAELEARAEIERAAQEMETARIEDMAYLYETLFSEGIGGIWDVFARQGLQAISEVAAKWTASMGQPGGNGGIGGLISGLGAAASANPMALVAVGSTIASGIGKEIAKLTGVKYSESASKIGGLFSLPGALLAGVIGGLFKKTPSGNLGITNSGQTQVRSNNADSAEALGGIAGSLTDTLANIANALGGSVGDYSVSVGQRNGFYRVGADSSFDAGAKSSKGAIYDGEDAEKALAAALGNAIADGAIIASESIRRLLGNGSDIQAQLDKAVKLKSVFDSLLEATDPVAFAMQEIAKEATSLRKIFDEAGASAAEYADLEKLIAMRREEAVEAAQSAKLDDITEKFALQIRMLELMGQGEEALTAARILEIAGMKAALQPLQAMVYELEDARGVIEKFGPLGDSLRTFREELLGQGGNGSFGALTARFRNTAGNAATGDADALAALQGDATAYLDAARLNAGSALEYQRALSEVLVGTDKGIFAADTQVQMAQLQIDAISNQTNVLQQMRTEIREANVQIAGNTGAMMRLLQRAVDDGLIVRTAADEPLATVPAA